MLLRLMLALAIVLMPNLLYVSVDTGIPGVNTATLLLALLMVALLFSRRDTSIAVTPGILAAPLLCWFVVLGLGLVLARMTMPLSLMSDLVHLKNVVFYPLFYFVYRQCRQDLAGTRQLIYLSMAVAVAAGVHAIVQGMAFDIGSFDDAQRAAGPFGDARASNRAGVFYAMFLPMLFAVALFFRGRKRWQVAALAGSVILVMAILLTYSRQSYLIAVACLTLLLVRRHLVLAVLLAVLAVPAVTLLPASVTQRVIATEQYDAVGASRLDESTGSRFEIWAGAWRMWKEHPAGVGINRFDKQIGDYSKYQMTDAHSIYVLTLAELGPLGVTVLLWLLWRLLKLGLAVRNAAPRADPEATALGLGFLVMVLALALGNVYGTPFTEGLVMANFWILCGLMERYAVLRKSAMAPGWTAQAATETALLIGSRFPLAARVLPGRYQRAPE